MEPERVPAKPNLIFSAIRWIGGESGARRLLARVLAVALFAYIWTGYFYTPRDHNDRTTSFIGNVFLHEPWALFLFYAFLMLALEISILMDPNLPRPWRPSRRRISAIVAFTLFVLIVVSIGYLVRHYISDWLAHPPEWLKDLLNNLQSWIGKASAQKRLVFTLADLAGLIFLWLGIHFASYDPSNPSEIAGGPPAHSGRRRLAGDLLLSALFSFLLAWAFYWPFYSINLAQASQTGAVSVRAATGLSACDLSVVGLTCISPPLSWTSLFLVDAFFIPLICVASAIVILVYEALVVATERHDEEEYPDVILDTFWDVVRRRFTWPNLLMALRYFWPFLLIGATILAAGAAELQTSYLHSVANSNARDPYNVNIFLVASPYPLMWELGAALAALIAMALVVTATTLQVVPHAPRDMTLHRERAFQQHHVRFLALLIAQAYCGFALFLTLTNWLGLIVVSVINQSADPKIQLWYPFPLLDPLTLLSLIIFAVFAARRWRVRRSQRQ